MNKKILALAMAMLVSQPAFADFEAESTNKGIRVFGQADSETTVFIYAPGVTPEGIDSAEEGKAFSLMGKIVAADDFKSGEKADKTYKLDNEAVFGKYNVYIKSDSGIGIKSIDYINCAAVETYFKKYDDENADMQSEFKKLAELAGMDLSLFFELSGEKQAETIESFRDISDEEPTKAFAELRQRLAEKMIVTALAGNDKDFAKKCIAAYAQQTDIMPEIYSELGGEADKVIGKVLGKCDNKEALKKELLYYSTVFGANICNTWKSLKDYVEANKEVFKNTDGYSDSVWNGLIEKLPIDSADDIAAGLASLSNLNRGGGSANSSKTNSDKKSSADFIKLPAPTVNNDEKTEERDAFTDVPKSHWAYNAIEKLAEAKIISGYTDGSFGASDKITREQAAAIFVNAFFELSQGIPSFIDVKEDDWFCAYVFTAENNGFIKGYAGKFGVGEYVTRQDFAVMLYRILCMQGRNFEEYAEFADSDTISDYAKEAVGKLGGDKIISGKDGLFAPLEGITRAEAAQMIYGVLM